MPRQTNILVMVAVIVAFSFLSFGKTSKLTGKVVAYDPMHHASKTSSGVHNQEVIVLEIGGPKQKYAKVLFSSPGTAQIEEKYFDGTLPLTVDVFRDHSCDENAPSFVSQVSVEQIGQAYVLTEAFKTQPPAKIKTLECYVAIYRTRSIQKDAN